MTAWMVVTDVSKSSTRALMDTFIADWSSTMTNCAIANATRGSQLVFTGAPVGASVGVRGDPAALTVALLLAPTRGRCRRDPNSARGSRTDAGHSDRRNRGRARRVTLRGQVHTDTMGASRPRVLPSASTPLGVVCR